MKPELYRDKHKGQVWLVIETKDGYNICPAAKPKQLCGCDEIPSWLVKIN